MDTSLQPTLDLSSKDKAHTYILASPRKIQAFQTAAVPECHLNACNVMGQQQNI